MNDVRLHRAIIAEFGHVLRPQSMVLDFGCGDGHMVDEYRSAGVQAFGADVSLERRHEWLRPITVSDAVYRIPFPDDTFDFVFSNSVLEHVEDLDSALDEIRRVLKPGGATLHLFPPPGRPIEPHVFVPLGGVLQNRSWLLLWAAAGIRNSFQQHSSFVQRATGNYEYLHTKTFYRSKRNLRQTFGRYFRKVVFADRQMLKHSYGRARHLSALADRLPLVGACYGSFHQRSVFAEK